MLSVFALLTVGEAGGDVDIATSSPGVDDERTSEDEDDDDEEEVEEDEDATGSWGATQNDVMPTAAAIHEFTLEEKRAILRRVSVRTSEDFHNSHP